MPLLIYCYRDETACERETKGVRQCSSYSLMAYFDSCFLIIIFPAREREREREMPDVVGLINTHTHTHSVCAYVGYFIQLLNCCWYVKQMSIWQQATKYTTKSFLPIIIIIVIKEERERERESLEAACEAVKSISLILSGRSKVVIIIIETLVGVCRVWAIQ